MFGLVFQIKTLPVVILIFKNYFVFLNNTAGAASIDNIQVFQILRLVLVLTLLDSTWVRLLLKIGPEHQLDIFEGQTRPNLYRRRRPATIMNDHAHEPITELYLVLQSRDLFLEVELHVTYGGRLYDVVRGEGLPVSGLEFEITLIVLLHVLLRKFNNLLHLTLFIQERLIIAGIAAGFVRHWVGWKTRWPLWLSHLNFEWSLQLFLGLVQWGVHFRFFVLFYYY